MISVIIPTLNEEKAIENVVEGFPDSYRDEEIELYVIDGGSDDRTVERSLEAGANVIHQTLEGGKGDAMREAFREIESDYYVMIDGDGTYDPSEVGRLLDPLLDGEAKHVVGKRTNREKGAIPLLNRCGNRLFNFMASASTGRKVQDMLSGYRAFSSDSLNHYGFTSPGFGIETEMTFSAIEANLPIKEVEISYVNRKGKSKLDPVSDGWRILKTVIWSTRDLNPLKFFTFSALALLVLATYPSYLVFQQKLTTGRVQDLGPVMLSAMLIIVAVQLLIFGMLADQVRNMEKRIENSFDHG